MDANTEDHVSITQGADGQLQNEQRGLKEGSPLDTLILNFQPPNGTERPQRGQPFRHLDPKLPASKW